jgi:hypothetical protein
MPRGLDNIRKIAEDDSWAIEARFKQAVLDEAFEQEQDTLLRSERRNRREGTLGFARYVEYQAIYDELRADSAPAEIGLD